MIIPSESFVKIPTFSNIMDQGYACADGYDEDIEAKIKGAFQIVKYCTTEYDDTVDVVDLYSCLWSIVYNGSNFGGEIHTVNRKRRNIPESHSIEHKGEILNGSDHR